MVNAPFHSFTMKDAISGGHIVNILSDVTHIRLNVETSVPDRVRHELVKRRLWLQVIDKACQVDRVLRYKALIMIKDFAERKSSFPAGKGMVAARSREDVVRYHQLLSSLVIKRYATKLLLKNILE